MHDNEKGRLTRQITISIAIAMTIVAMMIAALIFWSTQAADQAAMSRQSHLVATVLKQSMAQIAHDQEASTVWDDAVVQLRAPKPDPDWLDANLGVWFHTYYGHDRIFIVDAADRPIYAMSEGRRVEPVPAFRKDRTTIAPLIAKLRDMIRRGASANSDPTALSPGAADFAFIDGHPAIVSVKPIVPESNKVVQAAGHEFVHVTARYLDGNFMTRLAEQYGFDHARFALSPVIGDAEAAVPVLASNGRKIGQIVWQPFKPGASVLHRIALALFSALLGMVAIVILLIRRIGRGTLELHASKSHAQHLAFHDVLTGLANRALFDDRLDQELSKVRRDQHQTALLYLDLDRFKNVNDTLGHPAGDELIRQWAQRLKSVLRESDTVARLGGDEFAIIQECIRSHADVEVLCMRIVEETATSFNLGGHLVNVGVSIGVAIAPRDGDDRVELSRKADIALYRAKANGRGRFVIFAPDMDEGVRARQRLEADLRSALAIGGQFEVYYQPLYSTPSHQIVGVEALVRWHHPETGLMSPAAFIPMAEETGLIAPLGEWVLAQACTTAREWPIETVAVNVSAHQLRSPEFARIVLAIVHRTGFDPRKLELEITETAFIENAKACASNIAALRTHGIRIALDDFGTGYSSFSHLREFSVDRVKIDRSFVSSIDSKNGGSAIIQAIVDLAGASGIEVTAEGVETKEQSRFLSSIGCRSQQGFLMARPMPGAELDKLLHASRPAAAGQSR